MSKSPSTLPAPAFNDEKHHLRIYQSDCLDLLPQIPESSIDLVFADPPYFLSNGGITCHAGKMVSVNKGAWDKSRGPDANHAFNTAWLAACQRVLKPNGSIWVSGTSHVIHSVGFAMQQLGFKLLNDISWVKPNPPPNLSCRYFTHATETIIWAAKNSKSRHTFNYKLMKEANRGKQMKSVWEIRPPNPGRKNSASTPPKSLSPSSNASSSPPPTKATSSSTLLRQRHHTPRRLPSPPPRPRLRTERRIPHSLSSPHLFQSGTARSFFNLRPVSP
jgi:DNA modification methylase